MRSSLRTHHQALDVVLLGDRDEFVDDAADEMVSDGLGQSRMEGARYHHVVQGGMAGAGRINAEDEDRPVGESAEQGQEERT